MIRSFVLPVALSLAAVSAVPAFAMDTPPADPGTPGGTSSGGSTASSSGGGSGSPTSIPEPGMIGLFALGTMGVIAARRMRRRN
ncbi:PEP-CTERM sorting domain-containing protein [Sphingomonas kyeonggiensis]|uniref:Ice-binding protein C-terminal domain-containing protein n=1 Tax=Sphingomonas kyeonggiensis TaxID=1268553 RepID=A0A7W6NUX3_9SPHN|nr:PEP-CTERM sorting domain-containing protein [Sphingomonas kyeonggiensis]MBB4096518.1 hypothetical protein [Sphingomonas kyeonggiensis]